MSIIAWIVLGLGAGLFANMLTPGTRSQGLVITCVIGVAGALLGGWLATELFHVVTLHGFFNLSTWLTAIAGAAILLLAYHLAISQRRSAFAPLKPVKAPTGLVRAVDGKQVMSTGAGISLIAVGVIVRFAITTGSSSTGLDVQALGTGLTLLGAFCLALSLLVWGPLKPGRRQHGNPRSYDSGTSMLVRAEKRLYQDQDRQLLPREGLVHQDNQPL
jgi:uncharacterized membrane protein YeaQ/YmgE (transglycosylase-associated protein family)